MIIWFLDCTISCRLQDEKGAPRVHCFDLAHVDAPVRQRNSTRMEIKRQRAVPGGGEIGGGEWHLLQGPLTSHEGLQQKINGYGLSIGYFFVVRKPITLRWFSQVLCYISN